MRVAVFIDGKNFYSGYRASVPNRLLDFPKMAKWLVEQARGSFLWGVYYYTGIETGDNAGTGEQRGLTKFLDMLEMQPGYFVFRFPRKAKSSRCPSCQAVSRCTQEKEVDTTMVADMLRLAAVDAFDVMVLASGDADHAPAIEGVRSLGKQVFVATWSSKGLSARSRRAAFDHIDFVNGVETFAAALKGPEHTEPPLQDQSGATITSAPADEAGEPRYPEGDAHGHEHEDGIRESEEEFLRELRRATEKFAGRYIGANYFVTGWEAQSLTNSPDVRRRILDRLVAAGRVEVYLTGDGKKALRIT